MDTGKETDRPLVFADESPRKSQAGMETWKVLIVDDEEEVHVVTKLVFASTQFLSRKMEFFSAFSSVEARGILAREPDIAVILLDVVMESDDSGLGLVRFIREEQKNHAIRIILRTGQPGLAPEEKVIVDYDINDYKAKTELTAQKLRTCVFSAIRSWRDIITIERNRKGLKKIIEASTGLFELQSFKNLAAGALYQLAALIKADENALYANLTGLTATHDGNDFIVIMGSGKYQNSVGSPVSEALSDPLRAAFSDAVRDRSSCYADGCYIGFIETKSGSRNVLLLENVAELDPVDMELINIFCLNVSVAFENVYLNNEIETSHREVIMTLGEMIERRSHETGYHVKRVSEYARTLALACGSSEQDADLLAIASALHDVGKIAIPDGVLEKPGKLDPAEWEIMKTHSRIGENLLSFSHRLVFKVAALIAGQHHERWDGAGYPDGLKGDLIDRRARITALADVFDALSSDRVYRKALSVSETVEYIRKNAGSQFDPELVALFERELPTIEKIRSQFSDDVSSGARS